MFSGSQGCSIPSRNDGPEKVCLQATTFGESGEGLHAAALSAAGVPSEANATVASSRQTCSILLVNSRRTTHHYEERTQLPPM